MVTPGIFFSMGVDRRSNKPAAEVPTNTTLPEKKSGSTEPDKTSQAETVTKSLVGA